MTVLHEFLEHDVEGYLFHDLRAMQGVTAPPDAPGGGLGYPLLITTLAGIELLGAILSRRPFNTNSGRQYFADYWHRFLYPSNQPPPPEIDVVYQLARHGIAHNFLLKGPLGVVKGQPSHHLKHVGGRFLIDATQLANDLMFSYETRVKPHVSAPNADVDPVQMTDRLTEIASAYQGQAHPLIQPIMGPAMAATGPLPPGSGPSGPTGPISSDVSSSGLPKPPMAP
ncbi:MAG: hypothetical protein OEW06_14290 [Gemmatimonadota bacterium]|nr:hypothetical protein [Gemmatimonadota bacterium]